MNRIFSSAIVLPVVVVACSSSTTVTPGSSSSGGVDGGGDSGSTVGQCSAQRDNVLLPIDRVSTGAVSDVSGTAGTIYIDASAGGPSNASRNPRVYVNLGSRTRVDVTDKTALESTEWDLSLKRTVIFTNGGDGGMGFGGAAIVTKDFDAVTADDANTATIAKESFFDEECREKKDEFDLYLNTTFSSWYDYNQSTMGVSPKPNQTYIVVGGAGARYKVAILTFTANPDGTMTSATTARYLLKVAPL
jgi:hypothetical protein